MTDALRALIEAADDCSDCGVCCSHFRISFYQGELDCFPGGRVPDSMASKVNEHIACMKGTELGGGRCSGLRGELGKDARCGIYERRPQPCRDFPTRMEDGSPNPKCQQLREMAGLPPMRVFGEEAA